MRPAPRTIAARPTKRGEDHWDRSGCRGSTTEERAKNPIDISNGAIHESERQPSRITLTRVATTKQQAPMRRAGRRKRPSGLRKKVHINTLGQQTTANRDGLKRLLSKSRLGDTSVALLKISAFSPHFTSICPAAPDVPACKRHSFANNQCEYVAAGTRAEQALVSDLGTFTESFPSLKRSATQKTFESASGR